MVAKMYRARRTIMIRFENDSIDESEGMKDVIQEGKTLLRMRVRTREAKSVTLGACAVCVFGVYVLCECVSCACFDCLPYPSTALDARLTGTGKPCQYPRAKMREK